MTSHFGVWGSPIGHSRSPALHRAAIAVLGIDADYSAKEVSESSFREEFAALDGSWAGLSLTMPLKQISRTVVTTECDVAATTGAINTLVRTPSGWAGFNTDVWGAQTAISSAWGSSFDRAIVLGAGATSNSLIVALHRLGVTEVDIVVRDASRAEPAAAIARSLEIETSVAEFGTAIDPANILVSTLPGTAVLTAETIETLDAEFLFDVAYDPWPSALGKEWALRGLESMSGLSMLLWQAVRQARVLYGDSVDEPLPDEDLVVTAMRASVGL